MKKVKTNAEKQHVQALSLGRDCWSSPEQKGRYEKILQECPCKVLFDREEILERLFKALRELEFWADMHERVSKMMREREEKRQRQTEDRRLDSRDMYRNHFKSIGKNGKRKL